MKPKTLPYQGYYCEGSYPLNLSTVKVKRDDHPYEYEDFNIPISKEHWEGLFREVMKEYIKWLKF